MTIDVDGKINPETEWNISQLRRITTLKINGNLSHKPSGLLNKLVSLKTVELHVENVVDGLFIQSQIENVTIGKEVKEIGVRCFENCQKLKSVQFESNSENLC